MVFPYANHVHHRSCFGTASCQCIFAIYKPLLYWFLLQGRKGGGAPASSWNLTDLTTYKIVFQSPQYTDIMRWIFVFFFYLFKVHVHFDTNVDLRMKTRVGNLVPLHYYIIFFFNFEIWVLRGNSVYYTRKLL